MYITAVSHEHGHISHLFVHDVTANNILIKGVKRSIAEVLILLKTNNIYTLIWNYNDKSWKTGSKVDSIHSKYPPGHYLRSHADGIIKDNLENLLPLAAFL